MASVFAPCVEPLRIPVNQSNAQSVFLRQWHWGVTYGMILLAWACLWFLAAATQQVSPILPDWTDLSALLLTSHTHHASYSIILGMWMAMSVAMMLPGYIPILRTYNSLHEARLVPHAGFFTITAGYLAVWVIYSIVMALVNFAIETRTGLWIPHPLEDRVATGLLLAGAGFYQLSPFKDQCLRQCRNPMTIFMARGVGIPGRDFVTGLVFGLWCLGCCWLLMGIGLVAGMMSIAMMGLAMVVITLEKLPDVGRHVTGPLGLVLIAAGCGVMLEWL